MFQTCRHRIVSSLGFNETIKISTTKFQLQEFGKIVSFGFPPTVRFATRVQCCWLALSTMLCIAL
jgi:hypothetical protein